MAGPPPLLLYCPWASRPEWVSQLASSGAPVLDAFASNPTDDELALVEFAVVWLPPPGLLQRCPNLKGIQSLGAGVDVLLSDPSLPKGIPVSRLVDPLMSQRMATFVLGCIIAAQRKFDEYLDAQRAKVWDKSIENQRSTDNGKCRVGVLGAGEMGMTTARMIAGCGYDVAVWSRTGRRECPPNIQSFVGNDSLMDFARRTDVLVVLLPLTPDTRGIVGAALLAALPRGSVVINVGRGAHVDQEALLKALDSGHIRKAFLDVFPQEPLDPASPFWSHPSARVFPHISAMTNVSTSVPQVLTNIKRALGGDLPLVHQVDLEAGY